MYIIDTHAIKLHDIIHTLYLPRVTKLGGEVISDKEKEAILNARQEAQRLYQQVGSSPYAFTFLLDDPFPILYPSAALTMLYLLKSPSFARVQSAFVGERDGRLGSTPIIIPSLTPIITTHGADAIRHCRGLCKRPGRS